MKSFIGCSSSEKINKIYFDYSSKIIDILINKKYEIVFGCYNKGLMGLVYNKYKQTNLKMNAICIEHYKKDLDALDCNKILTKNTFEQCEIFIKSDILLFLPGGFGTLNELFYMINSNIIENHHSKIIIVNINHYYDELKNMINKIIKEKFAESIDFIYFIDNIEELDEIL